MDEARKLLDSLMGSHRNVDVREAKARKGQNFKEDNVCKFYLLGFCPQHEDLFHSTKRDIGTCSKVHSEALKSEFESHPSKQRYEEEYERKLRQYLEELVRGADEWVARERRNIQLANKQIEESGPNEIARAEISRLREQAKELFHEAEVLVEAGNFEESKKKIELAEEVQKKAAEWEEKARMLRNEDICEVCGTRMESGDVAKARYRHLEGKIHLGYEKIRRWLTDLRQKQRIREDKSSATDGRKGDRDRDRDRDREGRDQGDRRRSRSGCKVDGDKDKCRDRERSRRHHEREPEHDRSRDHDRDRARGGRDRGGCCREQASPDHDRGRNRKHDRSRDYERSGDRTRDRGREH